MTRYLKTTILILTTLLPVMLITACSEPSEETAETPAKIDVQSSGEVTQLPKLLDLGSVHCIPCKKMAPILDSLKTAYEGKAEIVFIDIKKERKKS